MAAARLALLCRGSVVHTGYGAVRSIGRCAPSVAGSDECMKPAAPLLRHWPRPPPRMSGTLLEFARTLGAEEGGYRHRLDLPAAVLSGDLLLRPLLSCATAMTVGERFVERSRC